MRLDERGTHATGEERRGGIGWNVQNFPPFLPLNPRGGGGETVVFMVLVQYLGLWDPFFPGGVGLD